MVLWHKPVDVRGRLTTPPAFVVQKDFGKEIMSKILLFIMGLLHILYPKRCPICDRVLKTPAFSGEYPICGSCREKAEYAAEPVCKKCGKPLTDQRREYCGDCTRHAHSFTQGKALWVYKGCVKESVYRLKYSNRREYGKSYAQELARQYGRWIRQKGVQAIIPIPLHKKRQRQRGYNQAEIIARELGRLLELPVCAGLLVRCADTRPQKELDDRERKANLKKAFRVNGDTEGLERVLLVDDIYTTGSTMDGAAEVLKRAGVPEIYVISVSIGRGY